MVARGNMSDSKDIDLVEEELAKFVEQNPTAAQQITQYMERLKSLHNGGSVNWKSTQIPKQTIRVTLKVDVPSHLEIKDLIEEMKKAESRLNQGTEFAFKI